MQALPRYSGIPTFMRVPFAQRLEDFDIALAGVPFDGGVTSAGQSHSVRDPVDEHAHPR